MPTLRLVGKRPMLSFAEVRSIRKMPAMRLDDFAMG